MNKTISPKQFANALGVSESSIKRWCDQGALQATRTPGGHRRIPVETAIAFARKSGRSLADPGILGLATVEVPMGADPHSILVRELLDGNEQRIRAICQSLFMQQGSFARSVDQIISPALNQMGLGCSDGSVKAYEERRALSILGNVFAELRSKTSVSAGAPIAFGGTPSHDLHELGSQLVELTLAQLGWQTFSLGSGCPFDEFVAAAKDIRPSLVWLSTAYQSSQTHFEDQIGELASQLSLLGVPLFVGGPAADGMTIPSANIITSMTAFVTSIEPMTRNRQVG